MLLDDFKMIVHKLPQSIPYINIYPIADVHVGSKECNIKLFNKWINTVKNDKYGYCVIAGDMMNMGLKNSKSNMYEEVLTPYQQKEELYKMLLPIKDKIISAVSGNHCYRNVKEVGTNPLYDVFCRLQIEDLYRENGCFVKINLGKRTVNGKPVSYGIVVTHGTSINKYDKFCNGIDGADVFISGHTHQPDYAPRGKIKMDMQNECVSVIGYRKIVCHSFQAYGGYALKAEYLPNVCESFQRITLCGNKKKVSFTDE